MFSGYGKFIKNDKVRNNFQFVESFYLEKMGIYIWLNWESNWKFTSIALKIECLGKDS